MKAYLFYIGDRTWRGSKDEAYLLVYGNSVVEAERKVHDFIRAKEACNDPDDWLIKNCTIE